MNVFEAMTNIGVTKEFQNEPVDEKIIGLILHSGTYALSAGNLQEWEFVVVEEDDRKEALSKASLEVKHVKKAPTVIVVCMDVRKAALKYGKRGELVYAGQDAGSCVTFMALAAYASGVGFDLIRNFDEEEVRGVIGLPESLRPMFIMPIGWPKSQREERKQIRFEDLTSVNRYGKKIDIDFKPVMNMIEDYLKKKKEQSRHI